MGGCNERQELKRVELVIGNSPIQVDAEMRRSMKLKSLTKGVHNRVEIKEIGQNSLPLVMRYKNREESIILDITREAQLEFDKVAKSQSWHVSKSKKKKKRRSNRTHASGKKQSSPFNKWEIRDSRDRKINIRDMCSDDEEIYGGLLVEASRDVVKNIAVYLPKFDEVGNNI